MSNVKFTMNKIYKLKVVLIIFLYFVLSLDGHSATPINAYPTNKIVTDTVLPDYLVLCGDSIVIPEFKILLELSEKAEIELKSTNETILICVEFYGRPIVKNIPPKFEKNIDNYLGLILATSKVELKEMRFAHLNELNFSGNYTIY